MPQTIAGLVTELRRFAKARDWDQFHSPKNLATALSVEAEAVVAESCARRTGGKVSASEVRSWKESLQQMAKALNDDEIPGDAGVAIEYRIPATAKRVDFILTGLGADQGARVIIVELKQWSEARRRAHVSSRAKRGIP